MAPDNIDEYQASGPFEGPEKLLEIWFAPSATLVPGPPGTNGKTGLRQVDRNIWEEMLDIVKCKVLSTMEGLEIDTYLLSESSLFIFPHKLILKTCGTTLNLLGVPRILEIAALHANMPTVHRLFYSRKSFMFPERQMGPHRDWKQEVEFLDSIFNGAAYTIGKVNGDHWLLYMVSPADSQTLPAQPPCPLDYTIEILMSNLSKSPRDAFFFNGEQTSRSPSLLARDISHELGINNIFPSHLTTLDAYAFTPCGYSSNALIRWGDVSPAVPPGEGYFTIHVTPEEGWSYASFECNVPLCLSHNGHTNLDALPDVETLVGRVVNIFRPGRLTLTLFISANDEGESGSAIEVAQQAFRAALTLGQANGNSIATDEKSKGTYRRTDKINYEFGDYGLAFASFEFCD